MLSDKVNVKGCVLYDGARVTCCVKPVKEITHEGQGRKDCQYLG